MIATACSHEHRIVPVIVIKNGHALGQTLIVMRRRQHRDAPLYAGPVVLAGPHRVAQPAVVQVPATVFARTGT